MNLKSKKRNIVFLPKEIIDNRYIGPLYGVFHENSGVYNIMPPNIQGISAEIIQIGEIYTERFFSEDESNVSLNGYWDGDTLAFVNRENIYELKAYNLVQNIFSRNTGILESNIMRDKNVVILGCGSVGSLVALELTRAGVENFLLVDNDIVEYHNICRHQCSIIDVGSYKVDALAKRIKQINPGASISAHATVVEQIKKDIFDSFCIPEKSIMIGCADNRAADVYGNSIAVSYGIPFLSVGFWDRAFAGEIFYYLPNTNMPCYKCALGDGGEFSQRNSTNRRFYTTEEDLAAVNFEPGISVDINFVTIVGIKLALDILNIGNEKFTPRLLPTLQQYTLVCNTNDARIGGEMAEIFSYPLQVTTSLKVGFGQDCPPCEFQRG